MVLAHLRTHLHWPENVLHAPKLRNGAALPSRLTHRSTLASSDTVLSIPQANVYRFGDANRATPVFHDVAWSVKANESWAVVGTGSGEKSLIFDMLMGHLRIHPPPQPPVGLFPFLSHSQNPRDPHDCVSVVSFANKRAGGGAFYDYTARYGAVREEDRYTLRQSMFPETIDDLKSHTRVSLDSHSNDYKLFDYLVDKMGMAALLDLPHIVLSNGQTRRARILKALLEKPRLLLLDEPTTGLDVDNRAAVLAILRELHQACNPHIILGLRMQDTIPEWITHLAVVNDGEMKVGPKDHMLAYKAQVQESTVAVDEIEQRVSSGPSICQPVVEMKNVCVTYGQRSILKNITWTIRQGQRYHLRGTNGSGKTTLLSLLTGDHPQSYTQLGPADTRHLLLFGMPRARLATPTLHARIGVLTPELFDAFPRRAPGMSVWEAIGTGFDGGFVPHGADGVGDGLTEAQREWRVARVWEVLAALGPHAWRGSGPHEDKTAGLREFGERRFLDLPVGAQRMVLLMRALVGQQQLVLLDEVWSGMDHGMVRAARRYLRSGGLGPEQAVVVVTHLEDEVPWSDKDGVMRVVLEDGVLRGVP